MADNRGPVTLITSLSDQRNRWKILAYAWRDVALRAIHSCSECGNPALWAHEPSSTYWCETHWKTAPAELSKHAAKVPWYNGLLRAMDLEDGIR